MRVAIGWGLAETGVLPLVWVERVFLLLVAATGFGLLRAMGLGAGAAALCSLVVAGTLLALQMSVPETRLMPYAMVLVVNVAIALIFARGFLPEREAVLLQFVRVTAPAGVRVAPDFARFMERQGAFWALTALSIALSAGVAMTWADLRPVAVRSLLGLAAFQIAFFVSAHYYVNWRYKRPETWLDTLRAMGRPSVWSALKL